MSQVKSFDTVLLESYQNTLKNSVNSMLDSIVASLAKQGVVDSDMAVMLDSLLAQRLAQKKGPVA